MPQSYLIHCKPSQEELLTNSNLIWSYNDEQDFDEIDVIVDNNSNLNEEQLCSHYGIDYDQVNYIELI